MRKLNVITLMIISVMSIAIVKSYGEEINMCLSKKLFLRSNVFDKMKYSDVKRLQERGLLRIVNELSECTQNERPRTLDMSINNEMRSGEINKTKSPQSQYVLTINKIGDGRGTVTLSPADTESDSDLSGRYTKGTLVVLTAMPDASSVFAGWKGDGCLGAGVCVLTMSSDKTVIATFHETNVSETFISPTREKSHPPVLNKEEATRCETKEAEKQTDGKAVQFQKRSESIYTVQVGAFRNDSYAKSLKMILIQRGYDAYMTNSKSKNKGEFHKVLIGRFDDKREAEKLSRKIAKTEGLQTFVTLYGIGQ
jgi:cell division septation protein DedD